MRTEFEGNWAIHKDLLSRQAVEEMKADLEWIDEVGESIRDQSKGEKTSVRLKRIEHIRNNEANFLA